MPKHTLAKRHASRVRSIKRIVKAGRKDLARSRKKK